MPALDSSTRLLPLTKGKFAIVDAADFKLLNQWKWRLFKKKTCETCYAIRSAWENGKYKTVRMHRTIMGEPEGLQVDHRDGNGLNNTRANLRVCTSQQNAFNRGIMRTNKSGKKGVYWHKESRKWEACITINGKNKFLGRFNDLLDAGKAYDEVAKAYHGEFFRA